MGGDGGYNSSIVKIEQEGKLSPRVTIAYGGIFYTVKRFQCNRLVTILASVCLYKYIFYKKTMSKLLVHRTLFKYQILSWIIVSKT